MTYTHKNSDAWMDGLLQHSNKTMFFNGPGSDGGDGGERGIRIDLPCEEEGDSDNDNDDVRITILPSLDSKDVTDSDTSATDRHFLNARVGQSEEQLMAGLNFINGAYETQGNHDLDQPFLSRPSVEEEQEIVRDNVSFLPRSLYPHRTQNEIPHHISDVNVAQSTSSSPSSLSGEELSRSKLSLSFLSICSSVSSLFASSHPGKEDSVQVLANSQSTASDRGRVILPSVHSSPSPSIRSSVVSEDIDLDRLSDINDSHQFGGFKTENMQDSDNFHRDAFLNVARRLAAEESILSGRQRSFTSTSSCISSSSFDSSTTKTEGRDDGDTTASRPSVCTRRQTHSRTQSPTPIEWWMEYTEEDWDNFARTAREILQVLEPNRSNDRRSKLPVLPPSPPTTQGYSASSGDNENQLHHQQLQHHLDPSTSRQLMDTFRPEFKCAICQQLIIGATTLDCGCENATVCTLCIESHDTPVQANHMHHVDDNLSQSNPSLPFRKSGKDDIIDDYVMVSLIMDDNGNQSMQCCNEPHSATKCTTTPVSAVIGTKKCSSCQSSYDKHIPCHALDVAILDAVKNLELLTNASTSDRNVSSDDIKAFQSIFYMRLLLWRQEVVRRHAAILRKYDHEQQLLLSTLIEREEKAFNGPRSCTGGKEQREKRAQKIKRNMLMEVSMFAAFALLGFVLPMRRRAW